MKENINNSRIVVAVDIGTSKVCAIAGRKNKHGKLEVLGFGKVASKGVKRGVVSNIEKVEKAIRETIESVQTNIEEEITQVHVGIAGQHITSRLHRGLITRKNTENEINAVDVDLLIQDMYKILLPPGDKILHIIPQEYTVDGETGILDPIGMSGSILEANFNIITGQINASKNINRCVTRCGLTTKSLTLEPIASGAAVLSEEEKEAGVALVDIGGGTTDITIYKNGIIRHTVVIQFAGDIITKDIESGCNIQPHNAEKLKKKHGSAMETELARRDLIIAVPMLTGQPPKEISEVNLVRIIQARMEDILDYVFLVIKNSGFHGKLIGGIVLTGGGALLKNIDKLCKLRTGMETRIGTPIEKFAHGYSRELNNPMYSTGVGLLLKALEDYDKGILEDEIIEEPIIEESKEEVVENEVKTSRWFDDIIGKAKDIFKDEDDHEF